LFGVAGMLIGVSFLAVVFVAASLWLWQRRRLQLKSWLGALVLVAWVVGVGIKVHFDRQRDSRVAPAVAALPSIAWPSPEQPSANSARTADSMAPSNDGSTPMQAAPISSLLGGLEQRLAAQPNDVDGWALLAQSYAFMGDGAAADAAVKKAVALGMDEQALRARVDSAMRGPHPN
jgi:cytochrome c-type biogenesis protein CcmH/NrfG